MIPIFFYLKVVCLTPYHAVESLSHRIYSKLLFRKLHHLKTIPSKAGSDETLVLYTLKGEMRPDPLYLPQNIPNYYYHLTKLP